MVSNEILKEQLHKTLEVSDFSGLGERYQGKVRDVYRQDDRLIILTTDRVSAFDRVLGTIPFKGAVLNGMAADAFERTQDILPNHIISLPDPNVMVVKRCQPYPIEFIIRDYITGSLWRDYQSGKAAAYGIDFPKNLKKDQKLDAPILTLTTKAEQGAHDEPISKAAVIEQGLLTPTQLKQSEAASFKLFARGREHAAKQGLILVDTKYEMGEDQGGELTLIDEIHTADSSRFWIASEYQTRFENEKTQAMLDKENLRGWLIEKFNFTGQGNAPKLSDEIRITLAKRYFEAYAFITGKPFEPEAGHVLRRVESNLKRIGIL